MIVVRKVKGLACIAREIQYKECSICNFSILERVEIVQRDLK
jgi:hypothetical protein